MNHFDNIGFIFQTKPTATKSFNTLASSLPLNIYIQNELGCRLS
ncbi:hypothetical protein [Wielerella bovis]|nr:hypothetical protein [Wielerella bovis]